jgi:hypothetical protein
MLLLHISVRFLIHKLMRLEIKNIIDTIEVVQSLVLRCVRLENLFLYDKYSRQKSIFWFEPTLII